MNYSLYGFQIITLSNCHKVFYSIPEHDKTLVVARTHALSNYMFAVPQNDSGSIHMRSVLSDIWNQNPTPLLTGHVNIDTLLKSSEA